MPNPSRVAPEPAKLHSWAELTESVALPVDFAAFLMTGRVELLRTIDRALTREESGMVLNLLRVLMETNQELQRHSSELSKLVDELRGLMRGVNTKLLQVRNFADFGATDDEDTDSE